MNLHTYAEARCGRWSMWYQWGQRPGPRRVVAALGQMIDRLKQRAGFVETTCPVDITESEETQRAVMALDPELRDVVFEAYTKGGTIEQKMKALGIGSKRTYYKRLERAYVQLLGFWNDIECGVPLPPVESNKPIEAVSRPRRVRRVSALPRVADRLRIA